VFYQTGVRSDVCIQPCATMPITYGFPAIDANASSYARTKLYFKSNVQVQISFRQKCLLYQQNSLFTYDIINGHNITKIMKELNSTLKAMFRYIRYFNSKVGKINKTNLKNIISYDIYNGQKNE